MYFLSLIFTTITLAYADQQVLTQGPRHGVLRRFNIESAVPQVLQAAQEHDLDVWHASRSFVDIYSPPDEPFLPKELADLPHTTNYLPTTPEASLRPANTEWDVSSLENSTFHESYHPLGEIEAFLGQLTATYPNTTRRIGLGESAQGREIPALTISTGGYVEEEQEDGKKKKKRKPRRKKKSPVGQDGEKLGFVILGAQHAREWVATATSLYLAHALTVDASEPGSLSTLLEHFDFHFVPVPNPDGYDYTWETDRYWYKNRQVLGPYTKCLGLDMNRNWASTSLAMFGYKWKPDSPDLTKNGTQKPRDPSNPCSHWYPGTRPFESYEVNNIANWVNTLPNIVAFIDLRSYGQMLSSPYSYTCKRLAKDAEDQLEAALGASQALRAVHGTEFQTGSLCSMLYPAPGNILDWMYSREAIKYSYVAHLRDTGTFGFSLPDKWIRPTGEETTRLVDYLARFIAKQAKRQF
ncbi:hypothetical protein NLJ89_g6100 [Agrocybe chaxingu]|uniref:Peptidase M14 domain-containing protein n=1 Tax=Agrocybe chaxingu TaxID=84603 RepID=A0A9W8JZF4_9AGAR|nr:hypothetical protein NLJ89_g6100 [Agrocybe chaxingu]